MWGKNVRIRHITRSYGKGAELLIIENIPTISCPSCGETYMTADTLHEIERIKLHGEDFAAPGMPHCMTQRGDRRQKTFFKKSDYTEYLALTAEQRHTYKVEIWACCLMPNHAHLIAVPET